MKTWLDWLLAGLLVLCIAMLAWQWFLSSERIT